MANIAEITEELVNLTAQEVNELSHVLSKPDIDPICVDKYQDYFSHEMSPKEYGMKLTNKRTKKR